VSTGLFALALVAAAPPAGLQKGDEFTFAGTVAEAVDRPALRFRRNHDLEVRVLVLDRQEKWADAAVLTRLRRTEDAVGGAAGVVTGAGPDKNTPPAVRLDLVRVHADGTVHLLLPVGPPPLKLGPDTPARALPPVSLDALAPSEFGMFPPRPPCSAPDRPWALGGLAPDIPPQMWQLKETDFVNAEQCQVLAMNQQSADWAEPVGGQRAWHRADAVWVSTRDGTARKVHRVIRQRDGRGPAPSAWVEVKYELKNQTQLNGRMFDRARRDIEVAYAALADAATLPPAVCEKRLAKLKDHLDESDAAGPYHETLLAARRALEAASRGDALPVPPTLPVAAAVPVRPLWPEVGQLAADFRAGTFRLAEQRGKPVVLVFFKPAGETTDLSLAIAEALQKRYGGKVAVAPLVAFGDAAAGAKDRDRLKFAVAVYDGVKVAADYGVETVPRFLVIDAAGKVRWAFTGVGAETGYLLREQVDALATPPIPPAGTAYPPTPPPLPPAGGP
jgi:peroxiredoxin